MACSAHLGQERLREGGLSEDLGQTSRGADPASRSLALQQWEGRISSLYLHFLACEMGP